ncbi:MAG: hypothetical protein ISR59_03835 [Anaerolineales bacterium]|uniref:Uncharacterized protein n=1 Tax=Candidatus Desulfolinea nitratireducens TaxID=2841698 RepID=A0A8J6NJ00_9CHLR|nr:hypothetical protein [Candidatus Desulfolinea nitratireducens]MBL6960215.1 hypothetical protein [Anaerolineales bacterium]
MAKVIVYLRDHEVLALNDLAEREYRVPKAQAALIIRKELERLQLVPCEEFATEVGSQDVSKSND